MTNESAIKQIVDEVCSGCYGSDEEPHKCKDCGFNRAIKALDVLPYHDMAVPKYENLGLEYPLEGVPPLTHDEALNARNIIISAIKRARGAK